MTRIIRLSVRLYTATLPLYPPDLRRDFGGEMIQVFAEDLEDAWKRRGWRGVFRVSGRAAWEFVRIALPRHADNPMVAVPFTLFVSSETLLSAQLMLVFRGHGAIPPDIIPVIILLPSAVAALTSLAAVYAGNRSLPTSLLSGSSLCSKSAI